MDRYRYRYRYVLTELDAKWNEAGDDGAKACAGTIYILI